MVRQGDIIKVDLNPTLGHEQSGYRPCVVVSNETFIEPPMTEVTGFLGCHRYCGEMTKRSPSPRRFEGLLRVDLLLIY